MVLTKKVTEADADRVLDKYIVVDDNLVENLAAAEDTDEMSSLLFNAAIEGADISFLMSYPSIIIYMVKKILEDREDIAEDGDKKERQALGKALIKIDRTGQDYGRREVSMIKTLKKIGYDVSKIADVYEKTYGGRTRSALFMKIRETK
jgi:hypothetical protein